ncbi:hypothetical protein BKA56DRAFT_621336 [Ilyonectria sp. MPI-CAGE-AT-0026]|nr:hypothetical protein BKA56DRAFT_621336 [Ilyonectria sp. MPI-CAGE-AT-0026]
MTGADHRCPRHAQQQSQPHSPLNRRTTHRSTPRRLRQFNSTAHDFSAPGNFIDVEPNKAVKTPASDYSCRPARIALESAPAVCIAPTLTSITVLPGRDMSLLDDGAVSCLARGRNLHRVGGGRCSGLSGLASDPALPSSPQWTPSTRALAPTSGIIGFFAAPKRPTQCYFSIFYKVPDPIELPFDDPFSDRARPQRWRSQDGARDKMSHRGYGHMGAAWVQGPDESRFLSSLPPVHRKNLILKKEETEVVSKHSSLIPPPHT